ncbi:MAG: amidohydrolase family protein, partial [Kiritimatiellae bacterium]|nr:amidohydrolase family protein [Kiritimatiellia bacterium]
MKQEFIIDAHVHTGWMGNLMAPEVDLAALLRLMDRLNIQSVICSDTRSITIGPEEYLPISRRAFDESKGRVFYLGVYDPNRPHESLEILRKAVKWPGFAGIKIHPSWHRTMANDRAYRSAWEYAAENDVTILAHTWSVSDYNPVQKFSTPGLFE